MRRVCGWKVVNFREGSGSTILGLLGYYHLAFKVKKKIYAKM